jgi:hypothetical protein
MAILLDKKERVYDIEMTSYGKYLLSVGQYKPDSYAFFDDNVVYDNQYNNISESQNSINERVKKQTPYISTLTIFEDINKTTQTLVRGHPDATPEEQELLKRSINYFESDVTPIQYTPRIDTFRFDTAIGDALLDSEHVDVAPAWKIVVLNGKITGSTRVLQTVPYGPIEQIPQVNITVAYEKEIINTTTTFPIAQTITEMDNRTAQFSDARYIRLKNQDPILYVDEVNTEFLSENFDIEVFVVTGSNLERKYFETQTPQIVNNLMTRQSPATGGTPADIPRTAVEYYFDLRRDSQTDPDIVCKQMQIYNKSSYYIDVDLACPEDGIEEIYNDIYGSEVVPEICLD